MAKPLIFPGVLRNRAPDRAVALKPSLFSRPQMVVIFTVTGLPACRQGGALAFHTTPFDSRLSDARVLCVVCLSWMSPSEQLARQLQWRHTYRTAARTLFLPRKPQLVTRQSPT